jgi:16S rRNA (adenine1518-N6/adenine1519-N6)-dimethyltransferase
MLHPGVRDSSENASRPERIAGFVSAKPAAKKSLGQNFLRDRNIARKIVALLNIAPTDSVLEIGPGPGALTRFIPEYNPARLLVVEKDAYWAEETALLLSEYGPTPPASTERDRSRAGGTSLFLTEPGIPPVAERAASRAGEAVRPSGGKRRVLTADALTLPFECFAPGWKVIGNLPYNIASPLLWELFSRMPRPARAVFMLQKEVGLRLTAAPGSRAYGALSVWLQSFTRPRAAFVVPPHVFHPRPKVESAVLVFEPRVSPCADVNGPERSPAPAGPLCAPADLARVLHICFGMRRKQLGSIAASCGIASRELETLGLDPHSRPEALTPRDFQRLAAARLFLSG